ncbi:MAG TPA: hypothetical protein VFZ22_22175 [Pyrinomonadaceae bacterium]|nr:hypothetical protein [Pyrinomonadaceae bacterium]
MWSIGIYTGDSPFQLAPTTPNPVLTHTDVTDIPAAFVADPFMIRRDGRWHMFFEVMNRETRRGEIALAVSDDGFSWTYERIVIRESFHLSYPYVFEWQGECYMVPETLGAGAVCLYKADDFPTRWSRQQKLIDRSHADPSILRFDDLWWLFVCATPFQHDVLRLYFALDLDGPWKEHPRSPIIRGDKYRARPAGRILCLDQRVIRFAQECVPRYGTRVRAFEISELTRERYAEVERKHPVLSPGGQEWNGSGMHHVDAHQLPDGKWIACVDGANRQSAIDNRQ